VTYMYKPPFLIPSIILLIISIPLAIGWIPRTDFMEYEPVKRFQMIGYGTPPTGLEVGCLSYPALCISGLLSLYLIRRTALL
jgi:hypothetical protein